MGKHKAANSLANGSAAVGDNPSTSGRKYTVSMAVPGSIIDNTQNIEFATFVAGQVSECVCGATALSSSSHCQSQNNQTVKCHCEHKCSGCRKGMYHAAAIGDQY